MFLKAYYKGDFITRRHRSDEVHNLQVEVAEMPIETTTSGSGEEDDPQPKRKHDDALVVTYVVDVVIKPKDMVKLYFCGFELFITMLYWMRLQKEYRKRRKPSCLMGNNRFSCRFSLQKLSQ